MQPMAAVRPSLTCGTRIRGSRPARAHRVLVSLWLVVLVALGTISTASFGGSDSPSGLDGMDTETLEQWLRLAYVETDERAGFGDFPVELLAEPTLYTTSGAVAILTALDVPIRDILAIATWIGSLRTEAGFYDDPSEGAPLLFETLWALSALRDLDALSTNSPVTVASLLDLIESDGLASPGGEQEPTLPQRLHEAWQIVRCLGALGVLQSDAVHVALQPTVDRCLQLLEEQKGDFSECQPWADDETHDLLWTATRILCAIDPGSLPEVGARLLEKQVGSIEDVPTDFIGSILISELLDVAESYYAWSVIPEDTVFAVRSYLVDHVLPTLEPFGAFGWTRAWGTWLDPQMNIEYVGLYARIGESLPYASRILDAFDAARIDSGWVRMAMAVPHPDYTYFGLTLSQSTEATFFSEEKINQGALTTLADPESDVQDLLYAVRILKDSQRYGVDEKELVASRVHRMWESELTEGVYWLVRLVLESEIAPNESIAGVLEERAQQDASAVSENRIMLVLREMAWLQSILDEEWLDPEAIAQAVLDLQSPQGGFLGRTDAPYPDLFATLCAIETLEALGKLDLVSASQCLNWVEGCYSGPGYLLGNPLDVPADEEGYVDLYSTYMAVRIMEILAASGS
ncbi:MAG: hypothetical protein E4H08_10520 [Candidatus Atribacteria bacterium]|nr:MAG: hypothetical protein E4H08_10520 [Candidatus Atribacteria bacterium]